MISYPNSNPGFFIVEGFRIKANGNDNGIFFYSDKANKDNLAMWTKWVVIKDNLIEFPQSDGVKLTYCERCYVIGNEIHHVAQASGTEQGIDCVACKLTTFASNNLHDIPNGGAVLKGGSLDSCIINNTMNVNVQTVFASEEQRTTCSSRRWRSQASTRARGS